MWVKHLWGFSLEAAYHIDLSDYVHNGWSLVHFIATLTEFADWRIRGIDENLQPSGSAAISHHWHGPFPTPQVVLKRDYQFALDDAPDSPAPTICSVPWFLFLTRPYIRNMTQIPRWILPTVISVTCRAVVRGAIP